MHRWQDVGQIVNSSTKRERSAHLTGLARTVLEVGQPTDCVHEPGAGRESSCAEVRARPTAPLHANPCPSRWGQQPEHPAMCGHTFGTPSERHAVRLKAFFPEVFVGVTGYPTATSPIPFTPAPTALATPTSTATAPQDATLANSRTARSGGHELAAVAAWILAGGDQA